MSHSLSSREEWVRRVSATHGAEGLCDRAWRFIAVSTPMWRGLGAPGSFVGRRTSDIPQFRQYAGAMASIPFFDGALRGIQCHSEAWVDGVLRAWDMDFWAVCAEGEMLVHIIANRVVARARGAFPGFRISDLRIVSADGRVTGDGTDAVVPWDVVSDAITGVES